MRTHQDIEARSLALHRLVAEKVRRDPALFERARGTLRRWLVDVDPRSRPYLEEWDRVFGEGLEAALRLASEDSERAATLRQCSPFAGLLESRERFAFLKAWRETHAA